MDYSELEPEFYEFHLPEKELKLSKAGFMQRILSYLIDLMIFYLLFFQIFNTIYFAKIGFPISDDFWAVSKYVEQNPVLQAKLLAGLFACGIIFLVYFVLTEYMFGASPGELIMHLTVKSKKGRLNVGQLIIRNLTKTLFIWLLPIDLLMCIFDPEKRRFSEIISDTYVDYAPPIEVEYQMGW